MTRKILAAAVLGLSCIGAAAAQTPCAGEPNRAQIMQWKKDVVDRFQTVVYLDANEQPMSDEAFLRSLYEKHMAFSMKDERRDGKLDGRTLKLRLLPAINQPKCS